MSKEPPSRIFLQQGFIHCHCQRRFDRQTLNAWLVQGQVNAAHEERESLAAEVKSTKEAQEGLKQEIETAKKQQILILEEIKSPRGSECFSPQSLQHSPVKGKYGPVYSSIACGVALLAVPVAAVAAFRSRVS